MKKIIFGFLLLVVVYTAKAATITVSSANETALKNAIAAANSGDIIDITATGTITLTSTIYFDKTITIQCSNTSGIIISGNSLVPVFEISIPSGTTYLKNLHILNGNSSGNGNAGGIFFYTPAFSGVSLSMENCTVSGCSTSGSNSFGGAIGGNADLNLLNCTFSGNSAADGGGALALYDNVAIVTINHCTFTGNNSATGITGGLDLYQNPNVTIKNSIIANNKVGAVVDNFEIAAASLTSGGYNLSDSPIPNSVASDLTSKNLATEIKLSALAANSGSTPTHATSLGSLAVNGAVTSISLKDQRSIARSGIADIGAYELLTPVVTTLDQTLLTSTSAQLNGQVVVNGFTLASNEFQYGASTGIYSTTVTASVTGTTTLATSYALSGLIGGQTVYYRAKATVGTSPAYSFYGAEKSFTTPQQSQSITFNALPTDKKYGDSDFALGATAPGGTVTYVSSDDAIASISGGNLHIVKAGTVTITASQAGNAQYSAAPSVDQTITIAKAPLTATASSASRKYGVANPAFTVSYSGFISGESAANLTTQPTATTAAVSNTAVGGYDVVASGGVSANYAFTYAKGTLTITAADLNIKANDKSRNYGATNPVFDYTYTGFISGESAVNLTTLPTASTTATASSPVNGYAITPSGAAATNYAITYTDGTLTVSKTPLTATASSASRKYGVANPAFTVSYSGFISGESAANLTTQPTATTAAVSNTAVGGYDVVASGGVSANYAFTYAKGTLTITAADLNIKANDKSKDYGDANPTFDYTYTGFISGESAANLTTLPTASTTATATSPVNGYAITPSGAAATNYAITYTDGTLTIDKVPLLITADDKTREVGQVNPSFTFSYSGFVAGDDETDLLTQPSGICAATTLSSAGDYDITPTGATSDNYAISVANGTLTVSTATGVDKSATSAVRISPNPSTGIFIIQGVDENALSQVEVRDVIGNIVLTTSDKIIDLTSKANGIYIVSVNVDNKTKVFKVVKK